MPIENRGFASLTPERRREIARKGGLRSRGGGRPRKQKPEDMELSRKAESVEKDEIE